MKKEVSEVFEKEQSNESCIHLYLEECGWCAYEVSAYLLMNLLGGKCIVEKIEKCGLKLVRAFLNIDLLGGINYGEYRYAGLNSYNLQLIGKDKVDKNSFLHWKKNNIKHHTTDFINRIFIYLPYYCNDNMGDIF